jgi:hypothetical protein
MMKVYRRLLKKYFQYRRNKTEITAKNYLRKDRELNNLIFEVKKQSESIGLSDFEYIKLFQMVRTVKPEYAFECGTGKSTFIIAHAMSKNGNGKKLVTMEESEDWANKQSETISYFFNHKKADIWFPGKTKDLIHLVHSSTTIDRHRIWSGSCYKSIIDYPYSFVMVDGPKLTDDCFINVDLINILKTADKSVFAWIDGRWATVAMCRALFGDRVVTKPWWRHSEIYGATQEDIYKENRLIVKVLLKMLMGSYLDIPRC